MRKLDAEKFQLIISDINLQDKSGLELLMKLQVSGRLKECPVLLCSGQKDADTKQLAKNMGAAGFIDKPFLCDALQNDVRALLQRPR
jgi:two-component system chemotaxis response regulator CheY